MPSFLRSPPATSRYKPPAQTPPPNAGGESGSAAPADNETPARNRVSRHTTNHVVPAAVPTPAPPAPQPAQKPTVTLADGPSKDRALHLLDETGAKLARVDRNSLSTDSATTYDQANVFLKSGRRAATEEDYVAASGFAEKAAMLAAKLAPASR